MKGIYLTEEAKKEIEAIIENLKKPAPHWDMEGKKVGVYVSDSMDDRRELYEQILSSATVLPVHEDWEKCVHYTLVPFFENDLPNGVIIEKNKQS
jgi:hypothetical protein